MEGDRIDMTERILHLTLEIIYLLAGENFHSVKSGDHLTITVPRFLTCDRNKKKKKILEATKKMMELLTGEVPIRCQDVSVYFSMEEWEYLEGHRDLYKDVVMENEPPLTSPDGSSKRNPPERCPHPLYSRDPTQEHHEIPQTRPLYSRDPTQEDLTVPHQDQSEDSIRMKIEVKTEEKTYVTGIQPSTEEVGMMVTVKEEDSSLDFSSGDDAWNSSEEHLPSSSVYTSTDPLNPEESSSGEPNTVKRKAGGAKSAPANDGKRSTSSPTLSVYRRMNAAERPFSCSECGKCFKTKGHLVFHNKIHSGVRPYLCSECGRRFISKSGLVRHLSQHTGVRPYPCPECEKSFVGKSDLASHLRFHTGERPYVCTECGQSFMQTGHLTKHLRIHTGERPFYCLECGKCFSWKDTLNKHQRTHMGKKTYTCRTCGKTFPLRSMLIMHQRTLTGEQPTNSECGNPLKTKSDFQEHQSDDTAQKTLPRSEREEVLTKKSDLVRLQEVHSSKEPSEHEKSSSQKESPAPHFKVHTVEKPFACSECGKCYSQKGHLRTHQRIHTGELPFTCSECGKSFNEKRYLISHQSSHTGVRAFSCSECGKCFTWKESLMRHLKFHSGVRPHSCSQCGKSFTLKGDLLRHQRTHVDKVLPS